VAVLQVSGSVNVKQVGAVGDGATDDTLAIQAALSSGKDVHGDSSIYAVTTLVPVSNQTWVNTRLIAMPSASSVSLRPVVRIHGVSNLRLENIRVNGNRNNLEDINLSAGEDGGMHGFRISEGSNGIRLVDCEANYCGTAGIALHTTGISTTTAEYLIKNIYVDGFIGNYNREHGMFADSFDGFTCNRSEFSYNGLTLVDGLPSTHGSTGAYTTKLFGAGFDLETYTGYPGSYFKNFYSSGIRAVGNSQPCLLYVPNSASENIETPAKNIHIKDFYMETGVDASSELWGLRLVGGTRSGSDYAIDGVYLTGVLIGHLEANNTKNITYTSGYIESDTSVTYKARVNNSAQSIVTVPSNRDNIKIETLGSNVVVKDTGAGTLIIGTSSAVIANGKHTLDLGFTISGALISGGAMSWTITLPTTVSAISSSIETYSGGSGKSVVSNVYDGGTNTVRIFITPNDDAIQGRLLIDVLLV